MKWTYLVIGHRWIGWCFRCGTETSLEDCSVPLPPAAPESTPIDPAAAARIVKKAWGRGPDPVAEWLVEHASAVCDPGWLNFDPKFLHEEFGVGVGALGSLIVPYSTHEQITGYKWRRVGDGIRSTRGSRFAGLLYGEWRTNGSEAVTVLCEGESCTWAAAQAYQDNDDVAVVGLPCGARTMPGRRRMEHLHGEVVVAFDGDLAGREGAEIWVAAIGPRARLVSPPERKDLRSLGMAGILNLIGV